jgi:glycosyltransferase involved in cell wall biosynthesis
MFENCPIVCTDVGGTRELLGEQGSTPTGWIVPPADPSAMTAAIIASLKDGEERSARSARARRRAEQFFTVGRMVEETVCVYREVLAERGRMRG